MQFTGNRSIEGRVLKQPSFWDAEDRSEEISAKGGSLETQANMDCSMGQ